MIRPDIPCWLVRSDYTQQWVGRVVMTGRRVQVPGSHLDGQWEIFAHWLPAALPCWYAPASYLHPLYGPDVALDVALELALPV